MSFGKASTDGLSLATECSDAATCLGRVRSRFFAGFLFRWRKLDLISELAAEPAEEVSTFCAIKLFSLARR